MRSPRRAREPTRARRELTWDASAARISSSTGSSRDASAARGSRDVIERAARPVRARARRRDRRRRRAARCVQRAPAATRPRSSTATTSTRSRRARSCSPTCATTTHARSRTPDRYVAEFNRAVARRCRSSRSRSRIGSDGRADRGLRPARRPADGGARRPQAARSTGCRFPRFDSSSCFGALLGRRSTAAGCSHRQGARLRPSAATATTR